MNILILTTHLNIGGIPRYVINLAKFLKKRGENVFVGSWGGEWEDKLKAEGIKTIFIPINTKSIVSLKIIRSFLIINGFLKYQSIDIIHSNTRVTQALAFLLYKIKGIPYLSTFHGCYKPHFFRRLFKFAGLKSIAVSNYVKEHLVNKLNIDNKDIKVIYNGIEIGEYQKEKDYLKIEAKDLKGFPVIGTVSRLTSEKNISLLIRAFPAILKKFFKAKLIILGEGREEKYLKELTKSLGLEKEVIFLKKVAPLSVFKIMDVFISLSKEEPFGFSVIEAQASSVPVIVSNSGALKEIVEDKKTGIVLKENNPSQILKALSLFLEDDNFKNRIVANAKRKLKSSFSLEKMGEATYSLYKEVKGKL